MASRHPQENQKGSKDAPREFGASEQGREFGGGDDFKGGHDLGGLGQGEAERKAREESTAKSDRAVPRGPDDTAKGGGDIANPAGSAGKK